MGAGVYWLLFLTVTLGALAAGQLLAAARERKGHVMRRLAQQASGAGPQLRVELVRKPLLGFAGHALLISMYERLDLFCRRAGLAVTPRRLLGAFAVLTTGFWLAALLLADGEANNLALHGLATFPVAAVMAGLSIWVWLSRRRARRLAALEEQMPLALDVIIRALRAGHPVVAAVRLAAEEMDEPIGSEFGLVVDETLYGLEFRQAVTNFALRTGSADADFFAVSISVQSETGGNLAEILSNLAGVIRSRATLVKRVRALSSEGQASALLLSVVPIFLIGFMLMLQPTFYTSKFSDPIFWPAVAGVGVAYLIGWVMIHRITHFKY